LPVALRTIGLDELRLIISEKTYSPADPQTTNPYSFKFLEAASAFLKPNSKILILGAGSGYEAIAIANKIPNVSITATDVNDDALGDLEANLFKYGLLESVRVVKSDLFEKLAGEKFDLILFAAPRPLHPDLLRLGPLDGVRLVSSLSKRTNNFDAWALIHERVLKEFPAYLDPGGSLILLTEEKFWHSRLLDDAFTKDVLAEGLWSPNYEKDGHFQVVRFHR